MTKGDATTIPNDTKELHLKFQEVFTRTFSAHKLCQDMTTQGVADAVGVDRKTVEKWIRGESVAHGGNIMALAALFGADFLGDLFRPFGFCGIHPIDYGDDNPFTVNASIADALSELSGALRDSRIDHTEAPEVMSKLTRAVRDAQALHRHLSRRKN